MAEPSRSTGDPRRLDWGKITTEFYHDQLKLALHVFNHDLQSAENVRRTIRFVVARLKWFEKHLPPGSKQALRFDDRGRIASDSVKQAIRAAVGSRVTSVVFTSEPAKQMSYNVIAEAAGPLDWSRLQSAVSAIQRAVEVFPIPAESPDEVDAVGISIPVDQADERAWEELMGLLDMFRLKFDMKAFELYSGLAFDPSTIGRIRQNFLG